MPQKLTTQKAQQLWSSGKRVKTLALLKSAAEAKPKDAHAAKEYGLCLLRCHYPSEGKAELTRAFKLVWPDTAGAFEICKTAFAAHQHGLLLEWLNPKAPQLAPQLVYFYATALDRHGRSSDASAALEQLPSETRIAIPYLQLIYAKLLLADKQDESAQKALEEVGEAKLPAEFQAERHYLLAQLRQRQGETETVFQALRRAKNILRDTPKAKTHNNLQAEQALSRAFIEAELPDFVELSESPGPVVLCGHPRSGTTLIEQILDRHPKVASVEEQSMFVDTVIQPRHTSAKQDVRQIVKQLRGNHSARADYLATMQRYMDDAGQADCSIWVDKHPDMTSFTAAYRTVVPDGRIIVMLRDPRDVVLSCFFQNFPVNPVSAAFLNLRTAAERYVSVMQALLDTKRALKGGWIETRYEDWVADAVSESKRICNFLNLEWSESLLSPQQNNKVVTSPSYQDVQRPIYTSAQGRWKRYEKQLKPVLKTLEPSCEQLGYPI